jgi:DNA-binding NarL/FixJ family response regulator
LRHGGREHGGVGLSSIAETFEAPNTMARILIADDYDAARRALRRPDLVILDLKMGMIDGLTAAREISAAMPCLPIVLCTVFATDALERESQESGVRAVVSKNEAGSKLVSVIEDLLKREF